MPKSRGDIQLVALVQEREHDGTFLACDSDTLMFRPACRRCERKRNENNATLKVVFVEQVLVASSDSLPSKREKLFLHRSEL